MIKFKLKEYTEYEAMRSLYIKLKEFYRGDNRHLIEIINQSSLIPILKGNNIVIEKFVINHPPFGQDTYRMYLKIGARAKMPDDVRFPSRPYTTRLGDLRLKFKGGYGGGLAQKVQELTNYRFSDISESRLFKQKIFKGGGGGGGDHYGISSEFSPYYQLETIKNNLSAEVLQFDKSSRTLVILTKTIEDAIFALKVLPFGLDYNIYLLDV